MVVEEVAKTLVKRKCKGSRCDSCFRVLPKSPQEWCSRICENWHAETYNHFKDLAAQSWSERQQRKQQEAYER